MRKLLIIAVWLGVYSPLLPAQEPTPQPGDRKTFLQRFFGEGQAGQARGARNPVPRAEAAWAVFPAGHLPIGKTVSEQEVEKIAVGNYAEQTIYLLGDFVVRAASGSTAVFRFVSGKPGIRVIVEYPSGVAAPAEGTKLAVDGSRGLLIKSVQRAPENTLNIHARDITVR
jgi:hypothetical protein